MTDTTATFYDVASFDDRIFPFGEYRQVIRFLVDGVVIGLGTLAAAFAVVATVILAAALILNTVVATIPNLDVKAPIGLGAITLANHHPPSAGAADITGSVRVSTDPADALTFGDRWIDATASTSTRVDAVPSVAQDPVEPARNVASLQPVGQAAGPVAAPDAEKRVAPQQALNRSRPLPDPESRTAVYDIAAHTVYLPNGDRLEAHSGLGNRLDDPRYVSVKDRGPTPPNVYDLALREQRFHNVRAIRLYPVGGDSMFGRDGMLAHSYMLGPGGQSNGCVAFKDYPAFLRAYLRGDVDRLIVVPHLENTVLARR